MPEIEPYLADDGITPVSPPSPRTALFWDGTHWHVPRVDDHGRVQVRGEDQLFSLKTITTARYSGVVSGASGYADVTPVAAGEWGIVTTIAARNRTRGVTQVELINRRGGVNYIVADRVAAIAQWEWVWWSGHTYLDGNGIIRAYFTASQAGDTVELVVTGYAMTVEV